MSQAVTFPRLNNKNQRAAPSARTKSKMMWNGVLDWNNRERHRDRVFKIREKIMARYQAASDARDKAQYTTYLNGILHTPQHLMLQIEYLPAAAVAFAVASEIPPDDEQYPWYPYPFDSSLVEFIHLPKPPCGEVPRDRHNFSSLMGKWVTITYVTRRHRSYH